ncbi:MAG TPA: branched-chain amino acid aminotransferase [Steroidobacteraceae bacterium]|jgi:branched-chain amino acid aminotransferase|nr:branched-chain amino acid aminotransferase [Steroidobacteraceae bacterium]
MRTSAAEAASFDIAPGVAAAVRSFKLPEQLGFGAVAAPVMYSVDWAGGAWGRGELKPYGPVELFPSARALQYGELVFEGLKAYRVGSAEPNLFRPHENCRRLERSAERLSMPAVPEDLFFEAIEAVVGACHRMIPRESGRSLYLRPFIYGTEPGYLLRNSTTFRFMVIANPVEVYSSGAMRVAIERDDVRAAVGGVGFAKASANYAASLRASNAAVARGLTVALWLDAREQRNIQELSGMNLFAVIGGELHTPTLDGAILPGITRDSLITLARHNGFTVRERVMPIDELLAQIGSGECSEAFACGTAAIVSPIGLLRDKDGREYVPAKIDANAAILREALLAIQERRAPDPFGWTREVATLSI